jgi:hypothetical protein
MTRYVAHALIASPFAVVAGLVIVNRERSIVEILSGTLGLTVLALSIAGVGLALSRERLLAAIDRRFFRQPIDTGATLLALGDRLRGATTEEEAALLARAAVEGALHPLRLTTVLLDRTGQMQAQEANLAPLSGGSALAQLVGASDVPLFVDLRENTPLARLAQSDRVWLQTVGAHVLVPMRGPRAELLGMLALGERRGELAYSGDDQRLLTAVGSTCGLALARLREAAAAVPSRVQPPARECVECGLVLPPDAIACRCGGPLQRATVPEELEGRLRFIRRVGAGAMGVVYEASDLNLRQARAVKTLPMTDPAHVGRVRREARAMAAATHPNLALLYGFETWGAAALLIMEFCEGGTLADRVKRGPIDASLTLGIGVSIANALHHLHERGVVHRDVKPSNIGFTGDGAPKLLDFGLAKLLEPLVGAAPSADGSTFTEGFSTEGMGAIRGTPAYLSPEVLGGAAPSVQDDLWSLAVTLLEAYTGANPFKAPTAAATVARVLLDRGRVDHATASLPPALKELFRHVLDHRQQYRPPSAAAFAERLQLVKHGVTHGED